MHAPRIDSTRGVKYDGTALLPVDLCDVGHQGLLFDKEWGGIARVRARDYHARLARWMQTDPIPFADGNSNFEALRSNPVNGLDPSGMNRYWGWSWWDVIPGVQIVHAVHDVVTAPVTLKEDAHVALTEAEGIYEREQWAKSQGYSNLQEAEMRLYPDREVTAGREESVEVAGHVTKAGAEICIALELTLLEARMATVETNAIPYPKSNPSAPLGKARFRFDSRTGRYHDVNTGRMVAAKDLPWPGNRGFTTSSRQTLTPGTVIDRYGSAGGRYAGKPGATISERGMAPGTESMAYTRYRVVGQVEAEVGPAAPVEVFGAEGGATQYLFEKPIQELLDEGVLEVVGTK